MAQTGQVSAARSRLSRAVGIVLGRKDSPQRVPARRVAAQRRRVRQLQSRLASREERLDRIGAENAELQGRVHEAQRMLAHLTGRVEVLSRELGGVSVTPESVAAANARDLSYLFVVAYGRSGSTLLQGILTSTPGVIIRGENGDVLSHLHRFHKTAVTRRDQKLSERHLEPAAFQPSNAWWGIDGYEDAVALRIVRELMLRTILRPQADTRVVGFKEVRWPRDLDTFTGLLSFMREVFPGARFVLNTRNLDEVVKSAWWARKTDSMATLTEYDALFRRVLEWLGDDGYHVHYNDYCADPTVLRGLFDWLGEEFDEQRVRETMQVPHSYTKMRARTPAKA